jgi:hypothetical protein
LLSDHKVSAILLSESFLIANKLFSSFPQFLWLIPTIKTVLDVSGANEHKRILIEAFCGRHAHLGSNTYTKSTVRGASRSLDGFSKLGG